MQNSAGICYCSYESFVKYQITLQCVIINKSDDKKTDRSRVEDSAVDY